MSSTLSDYGRKEQEKRAAREAYASRTESLNAIIKPLRTARYEVDHQWRDLQRAFDGYARDWGGFDLDPDFQRGHVWSPQQQRHFIENVLRGVVSSSGFLVQMNCPNWDFADADYVGDLPLGMQCIDGLQRITAAQQFLAGEVRPFGLSVGDLDGSAFSAKGSLLRFRVAVHNFQSRADLLQHYLDLNAGGTPHSPAEIERVGKLRDAALIG